MSSAKIIERTVEHAFQSAAAEARVMSANVSATTAIDFIHTAIRYAKKGDFVRSSRFSRAAIREVDDMRTHVAIACMQEPGNEDLGPVFARTLTCEFREPGEDDESKSSSKPSIRETSAGK